MDKTAAILESFQTDLRTLCTEARKKNPNIKEVHIFSQNSFEDSIIVCKGFVKQLY
jgi:hypothetical protein